MVDFAHLSPREEALSSAHTQGPGCAGWWFLDDMRDWAGLRWLLWSLLHLLVSLGRAGDPAMGRISYGGSSNEGAPSCVPSGPASHSVSTDLATPLSWRNTLPTPDTYSSCQTVSSAGSAPFRMICHDSERLPLAFCLSPPCYEYSSWHSVPLPSLSSSLVAKHPPKIQWLETSERTIAHIPGMASLLSGSHLVRTGCPGMASLAIWVSVGISGFIFIDLTFLHGCKHPDL